MFPEYEKLFSDTWGTSSKKLLEEYQTPEDLLSIDIAELASILKAKPWPTWLRQSRENT